VKEKVLAPSCQNTPMLALLAASTAVNDESQTTGFGVLTVILLPGSLVNNTVEVICEGSERR
jgi:hypothetical protein